MEVNNHIAINPDEKPSLLLVLTCWWSLGILQSHCDHQPDHQCQFLIHCVKQMIATQKKQTKKTKKKQKTTRSRLQANYGSLTICT